MIVTEVEIYICGNDNNSRILIGPHPFLLLFLCYISANAFNDALLWTMMLIIMHFNSPIYQ